MVLTFVIIWVVAFLIWNGQEKKKAQTKKVAPKNYYIAAHQAKLQNDRFYEEYINWCYKNNQVPMNKQTFIKSIEDKEKEIKNLYK